MAKRFPKFKKKYGAPEDVEAVPPEVVEAYRGRLPDELLDEWADVGWCSYADGFLWLVDPRLWEDAIAEWLPAPERKIVFARTGLGSLIYWDLDEASSLYLDVTAADTTFLWVDIPDTFDGALARKSWADDVMDHDYFREVLPRLGRPGKDECYGYFPPRAMGGDGSAASLQKVGVHEHLSFLAQVGG